MVIAWMGRKRSRQLERLFVVLVPQLQRRQAKRRPGEVGRLFDGRLILGKRLSEVFALLAVEVLTDQIGRCNREHRRMISRRRVAQRRCGLTNSVVQLPRPIVELLG